MTSTRRTAAEQKTRQAGPTDEEEKESRSIENEGEGQADKDGTVIPRLELRTSASHFSPLVASVLQTRWAGMGEPATLVESVTTPVITAVPTPAAGEMKGKAGFDSGKARGERRSLFGPSSSWGAFKVTGF